ncbi:MAG: DUF2975 domain-containing protein [Clostridia bacterium]|nr:DUF2975 domain-containing protein [Clostridia bacterium]
MKHSEKSVLLTQIIVRACYVLLFLAAIALTVMVFKGQVFRRSFAEINLLISFGKKVLIPFYLVVPAGYAALICLDKLLANVKQNKVFERSSVTLLRIISYCCFYAAAVGLVSYFVIAATSTPLESIFILSLGEGFVGLVVRVVKNVFEKAIEIKEENDLVI